jgi:hypothetical protein
MTGLRTGRPRNRGSIPSSVSELVPGVHPAIHNLETEEAVFPGEKRQGRESHHKPPYGDKVRNDGAFSPLLHASSWSIAQGKFTSAV